MRRRYPAWLLAAATAGVAAVALALIYLHSSPARPVERVEFPVAPAEGSRFTGTAPEFAISPDGRSVVFVATAANGQGLWIRPLAGLEPRELPETQGARNPFWSPDSASVGFFAAGRLKTIRLAGGSPVDLCPAGATIVSVAPAGTWSRDDTIVFGLYGDGLSRVAASGGTPAAVTAASHEEEHRWPWFLPDGRHFLYLVLNGDRRELRVTSVAEGGDVALGPSESHAAYADGHLFFVRGGNLMAQPFDAAAGRPLGDPVQLGIAAGIDPPWGRGMFSVQTPDGSSIDRRRGQRPS